MRMLGVLLPALAVLCGFSAAGAWAKGDPVHGLYVSQAAGCLGCHTDAKEGAEAYAGGRALVTPFGTFYGPNITPHDEAGIGRWGQAEFVKAMRRGLRPDGAHYYPAFPYTSFTQITDQDLHDLWAYLRTLPPSSRADQPHDLRFPFGWRFLLSGWKMLFFSPGPWVPDASQSAVVNRGGYLTEEMGHCGECHSPRNVFGAVRKDQSLAGARLPDGGRAPNLTPTRLKDWSDGELKDFLQSGFTPDGDVAAETMAEVVRNTTSKLTPLDLEALVAYLRSLAPLPDAAR
jgi:mono/diheme cytochrome c family protein